MSLVRNTRKNCWRRCRWSELQFRLFPRLFLFFVLSDILQLPVRKTEQNLCPKNLWWRNYDGNDPCRSFRSSGSVQSR